MSLPFLPYEEISPAFRILSDQTQNMEGQLKELMTYVEDTWIAGRVWKPENWSVFRETVRTNNDCEGKHVYI